MPTGIDPFGKTGPWILDFKKYRIQVSAIRQFSFGITLIITDLKNITCNPIVSSPVHLHQRLNLQVQVGDFNLQVK